MVASDRGLCGGRISSGRPLSDGGKPHQNTVSGGVKEGQGDPQPAALQQQKDPGYYPYHSKDGNEALYDLEKYDDEIACAQQELSEIAERKKEAISSFENVTRNIISDEIEGSRKAQILEMEAELNDTIAQLRSLEDSIRDQNIYITDTYGPYLGKEFLDPDRLSELSRLIQAGAASNITEAIALYKANGQKKADGQ